MGLSGKKASCSYSPSARVKKNISIKTLKYSSQVQNFVENNNLDSHSVKRMIAKGSVNFSESNTKLDSCKTYINGPMLVFILEFSFGFMNTY